ncbi:MAG: hypothetical protein H6705_12080 [Myxococcales bacterium]|nr:hypothetical protein [Myxococcales bacterium]
MDPDVERHRVQVRSTASARSIARLLPRTSTVGTGSVVIHMPLRSKPCSTSASTAARAVSSVLKVATRLAVMGVDLRSCRS